MTATQYFSSLDPLTEDFVVLAYVRHLQLDGWEIHSYCTGRQRGTDIVAEKEGIRLLVEAKGARGDQGNRNVVRTIFDSGQIRDHLGKAIVKAAELRLEEPSARIEILHPYTEAIRRIVEPVSRVIGQVGFRFVYIEADGTVRTDD